jgi:hypothetical protein
MDNNELSLFSQKIFIYLQMCPSMKHYIVPLSFFLLAVGCILLFNLIGSEVTAEGILQEPFFLIPLAWFFLLLSVVSGVGIGVWKFFGVNGAGSPSDSKQKHMKSLLSMQTRILAGLIIGAMIAYVDNFSFQGEVSPIVIVVILLVATIVIGVLWERRGILTTALLWLWLPMTHIVKKVLGLPDTLHPNTYVSILMFTVFTFVISSIGFIIGIAIHKIVIAQPNRAKT